MDGNQVQVLLSYLLDNFHVQFNFLNHSFLFSSLHIEAIVSTDFYSSAGTARTGFFLRSNHWIVPSERLIEKKVEDRI